MASALHPNIMARIFPTRPSPPNASPPRRCRHPLSLALIRPAADRVTEAGKGGRGKKAPSQW